MRRDLDAIPGMRQPRSLNEIDDDEVPSFDAIFTSGGHGTMVDMHRNADPARATAATR